MSKRSSRLLLEDLLDSILQIKAYTDGMDEIAFSRDRKTQDAVTRNLEIIGEVAGRLPPDLRAQAPEVPWSQIRGMRNRIVHAYFGVDYSVVWEVVSKDLPQVRKGVRRLLDSIEP